MSTDETPEGQASPPHRGSAAKGFLLCIAVNVGIFVVSCFWLFFLWPFLGVLQLAAIIPMIVSFRRKQEVETVKGLIAAAAIVFMLNATCDGLLFSGTWRIGG
jgi:formate-dependent nitrite reductase membrane component NrfD